MVDPNSISAEEKKRILEIFNRLVTSILNKLPGAVMSSAGEDDALQFISPEERIVLQLANFFSGCENHGTLHRAAWEGYYYRYSMREAGIVKCANIFEALRPLSLEEDNLNGEVDLSNDEYDDRMDTILTRMKKIEREMPSESLEEVRILLWAFAQRHGLDKQLEE